MSKKVLFYLSLILVIPFLLAVYNFHPWKPFSGLLWGKRTPPQSIPLVEVTQNTASAPSDSPRQFQTDSNTSAPVMNTSVPTSSPEALTLYEKGLKLYYARQFPEAIALFNQALNIDPRCYQALNAKGASLAFLGKYDEGLALIKQAQSINPTFVYAHFNEGLANELAGRWDKAIAAYHEALKLDKKDTWSYFGIASIYGRQGNVEKTIEYLKPAIELEPDAKAVAREERDFDPVRQDPRFQELVKP